MEIYVNETKDECLKRRIAKFQREWVHFQYLIENGHHPVDIADRLLKR